MIIVKSVHRFKVRKTDDEIILLDNESGRFYVIHEWLLPILNYLKQNISNEVSYENAILEKTLNVPQTFFRDTLSALSFYKIVEFESFDFSNFQKNAHRQIILPLEESSYEAIPCDTFGMPKRSCKLLPSGLK